MQRERNERDSYQLVCLPHAHSEARGLRIQSIDLPCEWQEISCLLGSSLLPRRACFSRKLESGADPGIEPSAVMWDMGI